MGPLDTYTRAATHSIPLLKLNTQETVYNLSKRQLTDAEKSLLNKGLLFIPDINKLPVSEFIEAKNRLVKDIKRKAVFDKKDKGAPGETKKFTRPSKWEPPFSRLDDETKELIITINKDTEEIIKNQNMDRKGNVKFPRKIPNISADEKTALDNLKNDQSIVIKAADKGSCVVVLDREAYIHEALRQLNNTKYYKKLEGPIYPKNIPPLTDIVHSLHRQGYIDTRQREYLLPDENKCRGRIFYLLPKIHKNKSKWTLPERMPEGRPIVSDCDSESYALSEYVDSFLQPLATRHPAYLKDTYHFVSLVRDKRVHRNSLIVTMDVTGLYTNMNIDRMLSTVKAAFEKYPNEKRPDAEIIQILDIILKGNDFTFLDAHYLQVHGTAMGKKMAPSLANFYLVFLDEMARNGFRIKPDYYGRFLDDIFIIWPGTLAELEEYKAFLNSLIPDIEVTFSVSNTENNFLDTTVYKMPTEDPDICTLKTRIYFKDTDTHQLLHTASYHPKHTTKGVLKSQLIRFKRISSCFTDYSWACQTLFNSITSRGYSFRMLRKMKREIWLDENTGPKRTVQSGGPPEKVLPMVLKFNPKAHIFINSWKNSVGKHPIFTNYKLIAAYKRNKNLRDCLVRSKLQPLSAPTPRHTNTPRRERPRGEFSQCAKTQCHTCTYHVDAGCYFVSHSTGKRFTLFNNSNCHSNNVIYLISCRRCGLQYVGQSHRRLHERICGHRSDINTKKSTTIAIHFNSTGHRITDLRVMCIETVPNPHNNDITLLLLNRENFWMNKLDTRFPAGLNNAPV